MRNATTFAFRPLDSAAARAILAWRYEPPYDVYNHDAGAPRRDGAADARDMENEDTAVKALLDPTNRYHAALGDGEVVGFCCFRPDARVAGGDGRGVQRPRARRACERVGFAETARFRRGRDGAEFVVLVRDAAEPGR